MKTLAEITAIRDGMKKKMALRYGEGEIRVVVAMGECGIASGAREVVKAFSESIESESLENIATVTLSDCIGNCMNEPIVRVIEGERTTVYGNMNPEKAKRVVSEHLKNGNVVSEYVLG